ncbi:MAG: hypothetical protein WKF30_12360 [Pyrinomonadaceae bacterium]
MVEAINLIVIRSKTTLSVRDKPYLDFPIARVVRDRNLGDTPARP